MSRARSDATARVVVRTLADLGDAITLAPERHHAMEIDAREAARGVPLGAIVTERAERVLPEALDGAIVFDTTHAKDGVLDVAAAKRASAKGTAESAKKRVREGDLLVSRLRPYLRQIALAHPAAMAACEERVVACSPEFYVLSPREGDDASLAFLVPWLLGDRAQATLAAAQEGGHHPRVPRESLLAMRIPKALAARRAAASRDVSKALETLYFAGDAYARLLTRW